MSPTGPRHSRDWIAAAVILVALAILPYLQTLGYDFVNYDDNFYVVENPYVQQGLTLPGIAWAFTTSQRWQLASLDVAVAHAGHQCVG